MAFDFMFFNNKNGDRAYEAADWASYFASFVGNGVFAGIGNSCQVAADEGLTVNVSTGRLWINGYLGINKDNYPITLAAADTTNPRVDSIVARVDLTQRAIILAAVTGTPAASPTAPPLVRSDAVYEIGLAQIAVAANATTITQANITDTRPVDELCGWVAGIINQIDTTGLFAQFTAAFNLWFSSLQNTLDSNQAANLYHMITTTAEETGTSIRKIQLGGI